MIFAILMLVLFVNVRLRDSRLGRAWVALREDEVAAVSMGIPLVRTKLMAYAIGAAFGGMAGVFLATFVPDVSSDQFHFTFSIFILSMVIVGGLGSIWGVLLGALLLSYINQYLIPDVLNGIPRRPRAELQPHRHRPRDLRLPARARDGAAARRACCLSEDGSSSWPRGSGSATPISRSPQLRTDFEARHERARATLRPPTPTSRRTALL